MQAYEQTHIKSKHGIYFSSGCVNTEDLCIVPDKVSHTEKILDSFEQFSNVSCTRTITVLWIFLQLFPFDHLQCYFVSAL